MPIIPLEKLIEYKGNRYELSRAMIELAKSGSVLLKNETKYRGGKYIPTVIKNILDGKIKYDYEEGSSMSIDKFAPFKSETSTYDELIYKVEEEELIEEYDNEDDDEDDMELEEELVNDVAEAASVDIDIEEETEEEEEVKSVKKTSTKKRVSKKTTKK